MTELTDIPFKLILVNSETGERAEKITKFNQTLCDKFKLNKEAVIELFDAGALEDISYEIEGLCSASIDTIIDSIDKNLSKDENDAQLTEEYSEEQKLIKENS